MQRGAACTRTCTFSFGAFRCQAGSPAFSQLTPPPPPCKSCSRPFALPLAVSLPRLCRDLLCIPRSTLVSGFAQRDKKHLDGFFPSLPLPLRHFRALSLKHRSLHVQVIARCVGLRNCQRSVNRQFVLLYKRTFIIVTARHANSCVHFASVRFFPSAFAARPTSWRPCGLETFGLPLCPFHAPPRWPGPTSPSLRFSQLP